jgi:hypothetical protein
MLLEAPHPPRHTVANQQRQSGSSTDRLGDSIFNSCSSSDDMALSFNTVVVGPMMVRSCSACDCRSSRTGASLSSALYRRLPCLALPCLAAPPNPPINHLQ